MTKVFGAPSLRLFLVAAVVACLSTPPIAFAQGYPPPQPTPKKTTKPKPKCNTPGVIEMDGRERVFRPTNDFERGQRMAVRGARDCATSRRPVKLILRTYNKAKIGSGRSRENGSYLITGVIPARAPYGKHRLEAHTSGYKYPASINISPSGRGRRSSFLGSTPVLAAWIALGAFILAFFVGTRRRKRPLLMEAVDLEVPLLDTSHFVPVIAPPAKRTRTRKTKANAKPAGATQKTKPRTAKPEAPDGTKAAKPKPAPKKAAKDATKAKSTPTLQRNHSRAPKARTPGKPEQPKNG